MAVNPGGNVYVTNFGSGTVSVINPATNTVTGEVYVTNFAGDTVSVIS
ncbi:Conserved protein of uncharacterised function PE-PGRS family protein (fragment 2) [Mycobacterium tuberculosis]|nr:Conserved protein of uncharacterised function PE-PGRS family protein (fragment 2) [Mycobacterium tuberculosis]